MYNLTQFHLIQSKFLTEKSYFGKCQEFPVTYPFMQIRDNFVIVGHTCKCYNIMLVKTISSNLGGYRVEYMIEIG